MPDISIGKINKAVNSTKRSGYTASISDGNALLKERCDIWNPTFIMQGSAGSYNYAKWGNRYYWVDSVTPYPNGIIEVSCHMDPLATYQTAISNTKAYAIYHSKVINTEADDPRFGPEVLSSKTVNTATDIFDATPTPTSGTVIVTVFESGLGSANQGVKTYKMSLSTFSSMLKNLQSSLYDSQFDMGGVRTSINNQLPNWTDPDNNVNMLGALGTVAIHDFIKALSDVVSNIGGFGSWRDNLIKAIYVPISSSSIPSNGSKNVHLGFMDTGVSASLCDPVYIRTKTTSLVIPWGPKTTNYHFLKYSRFQQFQAVCCGGQYANIDSNLIRDMAASDSLSVHTAIDVCSGDWSAVLAKDSAKNSLRLASFGGNMGIDITGLAGRGGLGMGMNYTLGGFNIAAKALSFGQAEIANNSSSAAAGIGSGIVSNYVSPSGSSAPSGIAGNGISSLFLNGSTGFNDLSISGQLTYPAIIDATGGGSYDTYCQKYGFPCNQYVQLSLDDSYVVCSGAFVECEGNQQAQAYINSILNSGILLEA